MAEIDIACVARRRGVASFNWCGGEGAAGPCRRRPAASRKRGPQPLVQAPAVGRQTPGCALCAAFFLSSWLGRLHRSCWCSIVKTASSWGRALGHRLSGSGVSTLVQGGPDRGRWWRLRRGASPWSGLAGIRAACWCPAPPPPPDASRLVSFRRGNPGGGQPAWVTPCLRAWCRARLDGSRTRGCRSGSLRSAGLGKASSRAAAGAGVANELLGRKSVLLARRLLGRGPAGWQAPLPSQAESDLLPCLLIARPVAR